MEKSSYVKSRCTRCGSCDLMVTYLSIAERHCIDRWLCDCGGGANGISAERHSSCRVITGQRAAVASNMATKLENLSDSPIIGKGPIHDSDEDIYCEGCYQKRYPVPYREYMLHDEGERAEIGFFISCSVCGRIVAEIVVSGGNLLEQAYQIQYIDDGDADGKTRLLGDLLGLCQV